MRFVLLVVFGLLAGISPNVAHAACGMSGAIGELIASPSAPLVGKTVTIYATIDPACDEDVEGSIAFSVDGSSLGAKPFSYKADGRPEEVFVTWNPPAAGTYVLRADATALQGTDSETRSVFIDADTDGDGLGDSKDSDDDNDGVPDTQDQFPLDPSKSKDTDGDGVDDSVDSDDDNDGVYDFREESAGTDPVKRDTDGDGVGDKQDAFPTDAKKSEPDPVEEPEPQAQPPNTADIKPAAQPASDSMVETAVANEPLDGDVGLEAATVLPGGGVPVPEDLNEMEPSLNEDEHKNPPAEAVGGSGAPLAAYILLGVGVLLAALAILFWRKSRER